MTARPKGGLGKGLSALIPDAATESHATPASEIEITRIQPRPDQPRTRFDPDALQELVQSVKSQGIIQPLIVTTRDGETNYTLVAGERRLRAARATGLFTVPCRVIENLSDRQIIEFSLVENLQREDLNPIELAEGYRRLIDQLSYTQMEVAERVGKDRATVANTLRLLALPEPVINYVIEGKLSAGHARALLSVPGEGDRVSLASRIVDKGMTVRDIERIAKSTRPANSKRKVNSAESRQNELAAKEVALELADDLNLSVTISHKGPGGRLSINYKNLDDLDRLVSLLKGG
jgi:ParB family transcriptional regulator, chromosome partitioning protein